MATVPKSGADFDFTRMFADMKFPAMLDLEAFTTATRRNMEAFTAANRIALEGAQAVARRHMEIMQQSMAEMSEAMRSLAGADTPQAKAARQAELVKQAYERAVANLKELSDLIQRSNQEALELLNRRFIESMDEVKHLAVALPGNPASTPPEVPPPPEDDAVSPRPARARPRQE